MRRVQLVFASPKAGEFRKTQRRRAIAAPNPPNKMTQAQNIAWDIFTSTDLASL